MTTLTKIKSGAKLTISGGYEADVKKTDSITLTNKTQLIGNDITFELAYVDKVTGSKFNDSVSLLTAPLKTGTIDLGKGSDILTINEGDYKLTLKNTETVVGTDGEESLQLSGVAAFSTDGTIDSLLGDKSGQTITFTAITADSSIDLGKGKDTIILADSIGEYELGFDADNDAITVTVGDNTLTIMNDAAGVNKSLKLVIDGITYTWDQAIAYAADDSADADANLAVAVAVGDLVTNNAEKGHVQLTITGVDSDAASVVVYLAADGDAFVQAAATKQNNGTWTVAPQDLGSLPDGEIGVFAKVTDHKGNEAWAGNPIISEPYTTLSLDTTADEGEDLAVALAEGDTLSQTAKDNSDETPVAFAVTGLDENVQAVVRISDDSSQVVASYNEGTGLWEADLSALGEGPLTASVTVTDAAGNTASATSEEINVVTDNFEGDVTTFQAQADGYFDDFVSVIVADTANAFNGSDLTGGNWASVNLINVTDEEPVSFSAAELGGLTLTLGTGNFVINGTGAEIAQLPESILTSLDDGDTVVVTDALSVEELETLAPIFATDAQFTYALSDSAEALLDLALAEGGDVALAGATAVTVEGNATVAQIESLLADAPALSYSTLRDTAAALLPEGAAAEVITGNIDIVVVDGADDIAALTLEQFNIVDAANGSGAISFKLNDSQVALFDGDATLELGAAAAIAAAEDITVVGTLDLAQANALKAANSASYTGVTFDLADAAATLFSGPISFTAGASEAIAAAGLVTINEGLNFSRALMVNGANGNSYNDLTFTLADSELNLFNGNGVADLREDALEMLEAATTIAITGDGLNVAQAALVYAANNNSFEGVTLVIKDTAAHIVNSDNAGLFADSDDTVTVAVEPAAVDGLSVTQLATLLERIDNDADVTYSLTLGELDIFAENDGTSLNNGYTTAIENATAVTVTDDLTPAQAQVINGINTATVYDVASGAAAAVDGANAAGMNGARDITITGTVSAADATTIAGFGNGGTTTYDVADDAVDAINGANAAGMNGARDITITGTVSAADATTIAGFGNGGTTTYDVEDDAADAINGTNAAGMNGARDITITGTANVQQAAVITGFGNDGTTLYAIEDDKAGVFVNETAVFDSSSAIAGASSVTLTDYITVAQAALLKQAMLDSDELTSISYRIRDTKEAIIAADDAGLFTTGDGIIVGDVDVDNTALGSITTANYATLTDRIGGDQALTFTYSFVKSDLFNPADSTTWKMGAEAAIQSATTVGISEALTAAQAQAVYVTNQDGTPAALTMDIADTAANITNGANADGVNASRHVSVNGTGINATAATVVGTIEAFTNTGNTTYAEVTGSVTDVTTALGGGNAGLQGKVDDITVTGSATAGNVTTLEGYANTGDVTYATLADTATAIKALLTGNVGLQGRIDDLTVNGTGNDATVTTDLAIIEAYANTGNRTYAEVTGTVLQVSTALGADADLQAKVANLTVTGTAIASEVATIEDYANTGDQTYAEVADTAVAIKTLLDADLDLQADIGILTVDGTGGDNATEAGDVTIIEGYINTGTTTYAEVIGDAAAVKSALNANTDTVQARVTAITVTGATVTADVTTIEGYGNTGDQAYEEVTGSAANVMTVVGGGNQALQEDITTLTVTGTTSFVDAGTINGYDQYVGTVNFDRVDATYGELSDGDNAAIFANADVVYLTNYDIGTRTVAEVEALLANAKLKDSGGNAIAYDDLTFTLSDTATHLTAATGNTVAIMAQATSVTVDNDGLGNAETTVVQAKTIYDRNAVSTFDIVDSASWLATTAGAGNGADYDTVIKAGRDLTATTVASAAQADAIYDRDGASGHLFYDVSDSYSNLTTGGYAAGVSYAENITRSSGYSNFWGGGANDATALYALASTGDANGTANLFMGDLYYDTVSDWKAFIVTGNHPAVEDVLKYTYRVYDNASNVATAAGNGDLAILTGSTEVRVSDNMLVAQAETLWDALVGPFEGVSATAAKTYYQISDSVANLSNAKVSVNATSDAGDNAAVANADVIYVSDTAAAIHAAQNSNGIVDLSDAQVFQRMDELNSGGMTATASAGNQIIAGSTHGDNLNGGDDQDILYGNAGYDTLYGGNGADTLYGGDDRDTIYAGTGAGAGTGPNWRSVNDRIYGGNGGDNMFGSGIGGDYDRDQFIFAGNSKNALIAESGTFTTNRDYISNFGLGDSIDFSSVSDGNVQFFGSGSANAIAVAPGTLALSIRYEKNQQVMNWGDTELVTATKVMVDIANAQGVFDDVADMHIIIVGSNIDLNWNGSALAFGG